MIDREAVVQAVAGRYGIRISEDDPVLAFIAVHDVVIERYVEAWRETLTEAQAAADERHKAGEREAAARESSVERAADAAAKAAAAAIEGSMGEAVEAFQQAAREAAGEVSAGARRAQVAAMLAAAFPAAALVGIIAWLALS